MKSDAYIAKTVRGRIQAELNAVEGHHDVQILCAIESGSRAWRFPSSDSDYDVRFVYAHRLDTYLSIGPLPEVIECPIDDQLDINGWDLRKALGLLVQSNAVLFEWLTSPERYRETEIATRIRSFAQECYFLPALTYHYDRMARHAFDEIVTSGDSISFKAYCYALRASLALLWLRRYAEPPPMDLPALLDRELVTREQKDTVMDLVHRKSLTTEHSRTPRIETLDTILTSALAEKASRFKLPDRPAILSKANALFVSHLRDQS